MAMATTAWNPRCVVYEGLSVRSSFFQSPAAIPAPAPQNVERSRRNATIRAASSSGGATLPLFSFDGECTGSVFLDLKVASAHTARGLVHRGVITELQNRRRGTASTKTRAEVRGGGRKPYKQKGTGRARRGSQRTPLRPGGGIVFGPKPKDWGIKINKKEKRLAISTALQSAAVDSIAVEDFEEKFTEPKTKFFLAAMERWGVDVSKHSLIFATNVNDFLEKSSRNIKTVKMLTPRSLNLYDVLRADKILFTSSGIDYLNQSYGVKSQLEEEEEESDESEEEEEDGEEEIEEDQGDDEEDQSS
ncbi:50S ribosomal protein L4, chloroplastic [Selaginella moellendorffii]|uniref:50S ribosomal protein L4, chloroplastic n=1 Tax=Selaginella moellendorffii TaxID=88036 RepID=UPI000D1C2554|nr:50S ribosomal protein L4, chloroplastic [Selaginella moellendorffii]|eukprot:XP_002966361.2 50S ribosomal protein L4, chloroplastic [Selaginella moellendorffii]